jgi:hypothetical protein
MFFLALGRIRCLKDGFSARFIAKSWMWEGNRKALENASFVILIQVCNSDGKSLSIASNNRGATCNTDLHATVNSLV